MVLFGYLMLPINLFVLTEVAPQSSPEISLFRKTNNLVGTRLTQAGGTSGGLRSKQRQTISLYKVFQGFTLKSSLHPLGTFPLILWQEEAASSCSRGSLGWILVTISSWKWFGCPEQWWSPHLRGDLRVVWMWLLGTWI